MGNFFRSSLFADLALLSVAVIWGATFVVVKGSLENTPVFSYLFLRFFLAFLVLLPGLYLRRKALSLELLRGGMLLGVIYFAAFGTQTLGLQSISASLSAFLTGLYVIFVPFLAWTLFHLTPGRSLFLASLLAALGLWFLTAPAENPLSMHLGTGEYFTLACALFFALHILITDRLTRRYDTWLLVGVQLFTVTLLSAIASLLTEPSTLPPVWSRSLLISIAITGILATAYALFVQTMMQRYTTPTRTAIIFIMEPVSAALFGVFFAGEHLSALQILGAALIVGAMLLTELRGKSASD